MDKKLPKTMVAVMINQFKDTPHIETIEIPEPKYGQVIIPSKFLL